MTTRAKMQFFQRLVKCELSALRNDPCDGIVYVNVKGPEGADYFFCKKHGERFMAKARAWEAAEAERDAANAREREAAIANARVHVTDCSVPRPHAPLPQPRENRGRFCGLVPRDAVSIVAHVLGLNAPVLRRPVPPPRPRRAQVLVSRNKTVEEGGDAHGMCSLCDADHVGAFDVTIIRADGEPVAILSLCEGRMRDLAKAIMQALHETST